MWSSSLRSYNATDIDTENFDEVEDDSRWKQSLLRSQNVALSIFIQEEEK